LSWLPCHPRCARYVATIFSLESNLILLKEVKTAVALDSTPFLSLNCFILGDDSARTFTVKISNVDNVSILKKLIKDQNPSSLGNIDAKDIDLWQVSFPIDDLPSKNPPTVGPKLRSEKLVSHVFPSDLDIYHVHIIVRPPGQGEYDIDSALMLLIIPSRRTLP
jgi:hypothetical protein